MSPSPVSFSCFETPPLSPHAAFADSGNGANDDRQITNLACKGNLGTVMAEVCLYSCAVYMAVIAGELAFCLFQGEANLQLQAPASLTSLLPAHRKLVYMRHATLELPNLLCPSACMLLELNKGNCRHAGRSDAVPMFSC